MKKKITPILAAALVAFALNVNAETATVVPEFTALEAVAQNISDELVGHAATNQRNALIDANLAKVTAAWNAIHSYEDYEKLSQKSRNLITRYLDYKFTSFADDAQAILVAKIHPIPFKKYATPAQYQLMLADATVPEPNKLEVISLKRDYASADKINPRGIQPKDAAKYMRILDLWKVGQSDDTIRAKYLEIVEAWETKAEDYGTHYLGAKNVVTNRDEKKLTDKALAVFPTIE